MFTLLTKMTFVQWNVWRYNHRLDIVVRGLEFSCLVAPSPLIANPVWNSNDSSRAISDMIKFQQECVSGD